MRNYPTNVLYGQENNCSLVAMWNLTDKTEQEIFDKAMKVGFDEAEGLAIFQLKNLAKSLGLKIKDRPEIHNSWKLNSALTVNQVRKRYPKGTYILVVNKHVFTMIDGVIIDPNEDNHGLRRRVVFMMEVPNSKKSINFDISDEDRLYFRIDFRLATYSKSALREKLEWVEDCFKNGFSKSDLLEVFSSKEIEELIKRGIFHKK